MFLFVGISPLNKFASFVNSITQPQSLDMSEVAVTGEEELGVETGQHLAHIEQVTTPSSTRAH